MKKLGPLGDLLGMIPGMGKMAKGVDPREAEKGLKKTEAIISSMTLVERRSPDILNASRRRRIAAGSGTEVQDVNQLIKQFRDMQKIMGVGRPGFHPGRLELTPVGMALESSSPDIIINWESPNLVLVDFITFLRILMQFERLFNK